MSTASKRPQLELAELYQLKWLLGTLLALLSAWTVPYTDIAAWGWLGLITVAAGVVLWRPDWTARVPRLVHRLAFPVILTLTVWDCRLQMDRVLPALIRLTLMLLLYRMVTWRQRRDDLQVIVLGLFLVVVAGVLSVSVVFAAQILVFAGCALLFLLAITLTNAAGAAGPPPTGVRVSWLALAHRVCAVTNWRVALQAGGLFGGLVALSAAVFLLLPRFDLANGLFLDRVMSGKSKTGFNDEVRLDSVTDIQNDTAIAFTVDVTDRAQVPATLYWRMLVLDSYDKETFRTSKALRTSLQTVRVSPVRMYPGKADVKPDAPVWTFYFEPGTSRYLPMPGDFSEINFAEPQELQLSSRMRVVALPRPPAKMLAYRLDRIDLTPRLPGLVEDEAPGGNGPAYLDLSGIEAADQAELKQWADGLSAPPHNPAEFARSACIWLTHRHAYARQFELADETDGRKRDPIFRWLEGTSPGHCEFFAGAFVLLARAEGYATRMVVGFKGGTWNPFSENLVVRNTNAHAWAEIYDAGDQVWLRVDPLLGADALDGGAGKISGEAVLRLISERNLGARFDSLRIFWYRRIVSFDQGAQAELALAARELFDAYGRQLKDGVRHLLAGLADWLRHPWDLRRWSYWLGGAVLLLGGARGLAAIRLAWLRQRKGDQVRREAGHWRAKLAGTPPSPEKAEIGGQLERLRYGPAATWPAPGPVFGRARQLWRRARR